MGWRSEPGTEVRKTSCGAPVKELKGPVEAKVALDAGVDHVAERVRVQGQGPLLHLLEQRKRLRDQRVTCVARKHLGGAGKGSEIRHTKKRVGREEGGGVFWLPHSYEPE